MNITKCLEQLSSATGVSGEEKNACDTALKMLKKYDSNAFVKNGSVIGKIGKGKTMVLLDAHIDQVGLIVTYITDDGFIKVSNCGGIDRRLLPAQRVKIHGKKTIDGVIVSTPPHLADDDSKAMKWTDVMIDTGYTGDELREIVSLGDRITFVGEFEKLLGDRVTGVAMDDRSGVAAILYALSLIDAEKLGCTVAVLFSSQEEVGERGAKTAAFGINPDIALAVDVSFAYAVGEKEEKCGKLGEGVMIGIAPTLDRELYEELTALAKKKKIPYQIEVMSGQTGTNADQFSVNREGASAVTLSIPLRYMHTPVEIVDINDIKATGKLIAEYVRGVK